jgi:MFS family permease
MRPLLFTTLLGFAGHSLLVPIVPLWAATAAGASEFGAGLTNALMLTVTVAAQLVSVKLLEYLGWAHTLRIALGFLAIGALPLIWARSLDLILLLSATRGIGFGLLTVVTGAAAAAISTPRKRGMTLALYGLALTFPQLAIVPFAPWLASAVGFWLVFLIGCSSVLAVPFVSSLAQAVRLGRAAEARDAAYGGVNSDSRATAEVEAPATASMTAANSATRPPMPRGVRWSAAALMFAAVVSGGLISFIPQFASGATSAGVALLVLGGATAVGRLLAGMMHDRVSAGWLLLHWNAAMLIGATAVLLSFSFGGWAADGLLSVGATVYGFGFGAFQNSSLAIGFEVSAAALHSRVSMEWNIGFDVGLALGSVSLGAVAYFSSFGVAFGTMAGVSLLCAALATRKMIAALGG